MATSMPTVSYLSISCATRSFEPTPSVDSQPYAMADVDHIGVIADGEAHCSDILAQVVRLLHPMRSPVKAVEA